MRECVKTTQCWLEKGLVHPYRGRPSESTWINEAGTSPNLRNPIRRFVAHLLFIAPVDTHRHAHPVIYFVSSNLSL